MVSPSWCEWDWSCVEGILSPVRAEGNMPSGPGDRYELSPRRRCRVVARIRNFGRSGCSDPPRTSAGRRGMKVAQRVTGVPIAPGVGAMGWGQRWERLINDQERRRRGTCVSREAIEIVPPLRGSTPFCFLPRADALPGSPTWAVFARWGGLGYLLDAPTGAESLEQRRYQSPRVQFNLDQEFLDTAC